MENSRWHTHFKHNIFLTDQFNKYAWTEKNKEAIKESRLYVCIQNWIVSPKLTSLCVN